MNIDYKYEISENNKKFKGIVNIFIIGSLFVFIFWGAKELLNTIISYQHKSDITFIFSLF